MIMSSSQIPRRAAPNAQRGAVLFISLIILVVLALIGIAGMQTTTLQERMAGNYYTIGRAFENSEWGITITENAIHTAVQGGGHYNPPAPGGPQGTVVFDQSCANPDMDNWSWAMTAKTAYNTWVSRIDTCIPGQTSIKWGGGTSSKNKGEDTGSIYKITSAESDTTQGNMATNAVSMVSVQTVYVP